MPGQALLLPIRRSREVFAVLEGDTATQAVFNRIPRNRVEVHLHGAFINIPAGAGLTDSFISVGCVAHSLSEDISDFYSPFVAFHGRARTEMLAKASAL